MVGGSFALLSAGAKRTIRSGSKRRRVETGRFGCVEGRGDLVKIFWHDGLGFSLYAKRLERGRFTWPSASGGALSISSAQLAYLLEGIEWRNPVRTWRPSRVG